MKLNPIEKVKTTPSVVPSDDTKKTRDSGKIPLDGLDGRLSLDGLGGPEDERSGRTEVVVVAGGEYGSADELASAAQAEAQKLAPLLDTGASLMLTLGGGKIRFLGLYVSATATASIKRLADGRLEVEVSFSIGGGVALGPDAGEIEAVVASGAFAKISSKYAHEDLGTAWLLVRVGFEAQLRDRASAFGNAGRVVIRALSGEEAYAKRVEEALARLGELPDFDPQRYDTDEDYKAEIDEARAKAGLVETVQELGIEASLTAKVLAFLGFKFDVKRSTKTTTKRGKETVTTIPNFTQYMGELDPETGKPYEPEPHLVEVSKKTSHITELSAKVGPLSGKLVEEESGGVYTQKVEITGEMEMGGLALSGVDVVAAVFEMVRARYKGATQRELGPGVAIAKGVLRSGFAGLAKSAGITANAKLKVTLSRDASGAWTMKVEVQAVDAKGIKGLAKLEHTQGSLVFEEPLGKEVAPQPYCDYYDHGFHKKYTDKKKTGIEQLGESMSVHNQR